MEQVFAVFTAFLVAAGPLAVGVTKAVDLTRNLVDPDATKPRFLWNLEAFVLGVGLAIGWGYNLVGALAHAVPALSNSTALDGTTGQVLTGIAVGAMAGFWHDKLSQWSALSKVVGTDVVETDVLEPRG